MSTVADTQVLPIQEVLPMPSNLRSCLDSPSTPWRLNVDLFQKVKTKDWGSPAKSFKTYEIQESDPEYVFVSKYFNHQKPPHKRITRIICTHNPTLTAAFEAEIKNMEVNAQQRAFKPRGQKDNTRAERQRVLKRWNELTNLFSSLVIGSKKFERAKVLPLWHGSDREKCNSIMSGGFTFFGKHAYSNATAVPFPGNTDEGYFGSGIYFTNSARYAALYSDGYLLLSWVSMREPYPVVRDVPYPNKCADMEILKGKGAYQNYNAHYIPVVSIDLSRPDNMEYHPTFRGEASPWDEFVVFQRSQALPRFLIELGDTIPPSIAPAQEFSDLDRIRERVFGGGWRVYFEIMGEEPPLVAEATPAQELLEQVREFAFGKAQWAQHFGDVGEEPPLPANIISILSSPCPFFKGKIVKETHKLVLIPKTVDDEPFTLNSLIERVEKMPKSYLKSVEETYGNVSVDQSYWMLMTSDVLPTSRGMDYVSQYRLVRDNASYTIPSILEAVTIIITEFLQSEKTKRLYSNFPKPTYTRCREKIDAYQIVVGGFGEKGFDVGKRLGYWLGYHGIGAVRYLTERG